MKRKHHKPVKVVPCLHSEAMDDAASKRKRPHGRKRASAHLWRKKTGNIGTSLMVGEGKNRYRADAPPFIPGERVIIRKPK